MASQSACVRVPRQVVVQAQPGRRARSQRAGRHARGDKTDEQAGRRARTPGEVDRASAVVEPLPPTRTAGLNIPYGDSRRAARTGSQDEKEQTPAKLRRHEGDGDGSGALE